MGEAPQEASIQLVPRAVGCRMWSNRKREEELGAFGLVRVIDREEHQIGIIAAFGDKLDNAPGTWLPRPRSVPRAPALADDPSDFQPARAKFR